MSSIETSSVMEINRKFYEAIETHDIQLMQHVWSTESFSRCLHPGWPVLEGFSDIMASWVSIFGGGQKLTFSLRHITPVIREDLAALHFIENVLFEDPDGVREFNVSCTNIFLKSNGEWKMILHHASPNPVQP